MEEGHPERPCAKAQKQHWGTYSGQSTARGQCGHVTITDEARGKAAEKYWSFREQELLLGLDGEVGGQERASQESLLFKDNC
jgi:hypothetical protein